jgi:Potential Queuosine, Q, salvage protein family
MSIFDEIRTVTEEVSAQAEYVRICGEKIPAYCESLPPDRLEFPALDPRHHYLSHGPDTASFILVLDTINFGSGYFPHLRKLPGLSGYFTVATHLTKYFERNGPLSPTELRRVDSNWCRIQFDQTDGNGTSDELMSLFAQALNHLGEFLDNDYGSSFDNFFERTAGSAQTLVQALAKMPFFNDRQMYRGRSVPFFKRAQLTAADLYLAFSGQNYGQFHDIFDLTIFADNLVPHVLRCDGVLEYRSELACRIDDQKLIARDSNEEIEIRACALHAVELMTRYFRESGKPFTALHLDYLLWNRGQQPSYKSRPRHRAKSWFY